MKNIFLTSDQHFFHEAILQYQRKQFKDINEMNEVLIEQWNATIKPNDIVFQLGDFALGKDFEAIDKTCRLLNGKKTILLGNHDSPSKVKIYSQYFGIGAYHIFKDLEIILSHVPIIFEQRSESSNKLRKNIHGHIHNKDFSIKDTRYHNICYDIENKIYNLEEFI